MSDGWAVSLLFCASAISTSAMYIPGHTHIVIICYRRLQHNILCALIAWQPLLSAILVSKTKAGHLLIAVVVVLSYSAVFPSFVFATCRRRVALLEVLIYRFHMDLRK